ncbi:MAG: T9SS type A sorting domain-containing protein [Flavobacteriales bacterium]|nr:T9SS type A sorting domain-containing protein [Flavobacteriales bacterium]
MRQLSILSLLIHFAAYTQTTWNVQVGGSLSGGALPFYNPQNLVIDEGDEVVWTNVSGTHNVNGSTTLFPGNPESFNSGDPNFGNWTFSFTFTLPGTYNYHCTSQGHSATQNGQIVVVPSTTVSEITVAPSIQVYPIPASDLLFVEWTSPTLRSMEVYNLEGQRVMERSIAGVDRVGIGLQGLPVGAYFLRLIGTDGAVITRPFRKS